MPADALALALAAAFLHAAWNLRLAAGADSRASLAVASAAGAACCAPFALAAWELSSSALPWVAASVALEVTYFALLGRAYNTGEVSVVYPVARGSAPVIVLVVSVAFLGAGVSAAQAAGVLLVAAGVIAVRGRGGAGARGESSTHVGGRSAPRSPQGRHLVLALAVGAAIAGYTLVDNEGITHGAALSYLGMVLAFTAAINLAIVRALAGADALRAALDHGTLMAGFAKFASYALVLLALERAAAAPVAAVRESSVVIAAVLAAVLLKERVTRARLLGSAVVVAGVALIALG